MRREKERESLSHSPAHILSDSLMFGRYITWQLKLQLLNCLYIRLDIHNKQQSEVKRDIT